MKIVITMLTIFAMFTFFLSFGAKAVEPEEERRLETNEETQSYEEYTNYYENVEFNEEAYEIADYLSIDYDFELLIENIIIQNELIKEQNEYILENQGIMQMQKELITSFMYLIMGGLMGMGALIMWQPVRS